MEDEFKTAIYKYNPPASASNAWFGALDSKEDALKTVYDASLALYVLAGLQIMLGYFIGDAAVVEGVLFAVLGYLLRTMNTRAISRMILLVSSFMIVSSLTQVIRVHGSGLDHVAIALLALWVGLRAHRASAAIRNEFIRELRADYLQKTEPSEKKIAQAN